MNSNEILIRSILKDQVTSIDDLFYDYLALICEHLDEDVDEIDIFGRMHHDNFIPNPIKDITDGSWVFRIDKRTDGDFMQIVYAKPSTKKIDFQAIHRRNRLASITEDTDGMDSNMLGELLEKAEANLDTIKEKRYYSFLEASMLQPIFVSAPITKSKKIYIQPYEYNKVRDVMPYVNAAFKGTEGVKRKTMWTQQDNDAIFYMQTRGIPKDIAMLMVASNKMWIEINLETVMNAPDNIVVIEK